MAVGAGTELAKHGTYAAVYALSGNYGEIGAAVGHSSLELHLEAHVNTLWGNSGGTRL